MYFSGVKEKYEIRGFDGGVRPYCEQSYDMLLLRRLATRV
jgi:hypothetical protein